MALFGKREKAYEVWGDKPRWKEARQRLKDAGIKVMETGFYETEAPACGCGAKLDHRDFGPNGKIDRLTYYISVKPEDVERAKELLESTPGAWMPDQFNNPANARAHYETTGPELWRDTDGGVDVLVAGVGSGGTITGAGRYLKEQTPAIRVVAVEPAESPVLSGGRPGPHKIQGIGAGFVPGTLDMGVVDEVVAVTGDEAYAAARELARTEGVLAGVSSGAAAHAARILAQRPDMRGKTIAVVLPDTGERYLSTGLFA